jgi:hypothetical protein
MSDVRLVSFPSGEKSTIFVQFVRPQLNLLAQTGDHGHVL